MIVTGIPETGKQYLRRIMGDASFSSLRFRETMADGSGAGAVAASAIRHARLPLVRFSDNGGQIGGGSRGGVRHSAREITFCPVVGAMADRSGDCDGVRHSGQEITPCMVFGQWRMDRERSRGGIRHSACEITPSPFLEKWRIDRGL
ncbi:MAG: hypothetical protein C6P37_16240 [Caldibacillus debilis]|uniref:Uncharacterized protein n=1 Tax=Caldibacillus debilis TaxID=301148 RepID=A0A3E0JW14_9BACI|nr:MAG: hypothetical protein C6P37_16240 [Caldibacillus debilis]